MRNKYYTHIKTGNEYKVLFEAITKIDGVWTESIVYHCPDMQDNLVFVRLKSDFLVKFKEKFYDPNYD